MGVICTKCAELADINRFDFDGGDTTFWAHPENCGCYCQHRPPQEWEAQFSVEQP